MPSFWQQEAADLLRAIDPDAPPIYLLDCRESELAPPTEDGFHGVTSSRLDMRVRDLLKSRGEWKGRGFACFVAASALEERLAARGVTPKAIRRKLLSICVHEFGHHLDSAPPEPESQIDKTLASDPKLTTELRTPLLATTLDEYLERGTWQHHEGQRFGRIVLHLMHRANVIGEEFAGAASSM